MFPHQHPQNLNNECSHTGKQKPPLGPHCLCPCVPQRLLAELPEKEAQLPLIEALGQLVMEKSSTEGAAMVQEELKELAESWRGLRLLEENLLR